MTPLQSIVLGIIEGITEFLPISSTAHLILASDLLHLAEAEFTKSFEIIIQLGAILSVVVLYWSKFWNVETIKKLVIAMIPTGIIGLALHSFVKTHLLGNVNVVLTTMFVGGVALILFERWHKSAETELDLA